MTILEYRNKLAELIAQSKEKAIEEAVVPAANKLLATVKNRIQRQGKKTDGSAIGTYSTEPMYASRDQFDKKSAFKPIGKNEKKRKTTQVFDIGTQKKRSVPITADFRQRKSMYLEQGYKQLRDIQGKPTDKINFTYSGDLMLAYQQQQKDKSILQGLTSELEALKREGLEGRFGKTLTPMKEEINEYQKDVAKSLQQQQLKILKGA